MKIKIARALLSIMKFFTKGPSKRLRSKFLSKAIPVGTMCSLTVGEKKILCTIQGYVLSQRIQLPIGIILSFLPSDKKTTVRIENTNYSLQSLCVKLAPEEQFPYVDEELRVMTLDDEKEYIIASIDRIFDKRLMKVEKKAIRLKIPVGTNGF
jgi:hypothetical protein